VIPLAQSSHIVPVMVGDPVRLQGRFSDRLLERTLPSTSSRSTTRPCRSGTERLRLTPSPLHSEAEVERLVRALVDVWAATEVRRAA
jgi:5-aminolevulinate synthase